MADELARFITEATGQNHLRVEQDLGDGFVRLQSAEAERRQAKHDIRSSEDIVIEMLRNSRDARADAIYVACWKEGDMRNFTIIDNGEGIPLSKFERIFEPRVTSKLDSVHMDLWGIHGRGMALYAVKMNADAAHVAASMIDGGSSIHVETDTTSLGERRDQSSMPAFIIDENDVVTVRGPKNINRTVCEFAYIERSRCKVYFGSSIDIAATLWNHSLEDKGHAKLQESSDANSVDVCSRLALASNPDEFAAIADALALPFSPRSARRIMDGEISPLDPIDELIDPHHADERAVRFATADSGPCTTANEEETDFLSSILFKDTRGLKVDQRDRREFERAVMAAFRKLARVYYLDETVKPEIRFRRDRIDVVIPILKGE